MQQAVTVEEMFFTFFMCRHLSLLNFDFNVPNTWQSSGRSLCMASLAEAKSHQLYACPLEQGNVDLPQEVGLPLTNEMPLKLPG